MAAPFNPYSRIASMVYCEQEGKYLQRGAIFAEIKICQNLIGAINIFFTAAPQLSWLALRSVSPDRHGSCPRSLIRESQDGYVVVALLNNQQ